MNMDVIFNEKHKFRPKKAYTDIYNFVNKNKTRTLNASLVQQFHQFFLQNYISKEFIKYS